MNPGWLQKYTVATFQGYPSLPSDDSEMEVEMEGTSHPAIDGMAEIRQQFQLLQAQLSETKKELLDIKQKDKDKSFAQTWQEAVTPETQDLIRRVVAILKRPKVEDSQEFYVFFLKAEKAAGRGDRQTLRDLSRKLSMRRGCWILAVEPQHMTETQLKCLTGVVSWRNICQGLSVKRFLTMQ